MRLASLALIFTMFAATAAARTADASTCSLAYSADAYEYWTTTSPSSSSTRCTWYHGVPSCHWYGWLWKNAATTASTGKLPLVVYIHGSGQQKGRSSICEIVNTLVAKGYVVFMPYMRGVTDTSTYGNNHGFQNTGTYIEDYAAEGGATGDVYVANTLDMMEKEASGEVQAALDYMTSLKSGDGTKPLIDASKISLWGHSYGGAVVTIATGAGLSPQPAATIDMSGAVMSWPYSTVWETILDSYAASVKNPIYFQQTVNESPTSSFESTTSPFRQANTTLQGAQMNIFASIAPDSDTQANCTANGTPQYQCVHNAFIGDHGSVQHWIGSAIEFISRHGVK